MANAGHFKKGQVANPNGRPKKGTAVTDRLRAKMSKRADDLAEALIKKAVGGDVAAMREIFDRLEGKPKQAVDLGGQADNPILSKVIWERVNADSKTEDPGEA